MSLDIKYIKDTEGNNYFPVVHEKGVVDDNGTTLESKLQSKQDAIGDIDTIRNKANSAIQSITVGTTTTGEAGSSANVINTGTATTPILSFTIPQGAQGIQGPTGPQGERGLPGESGVTGDVSGFTVHQTINSSTTYGATDIAGAASLQATNQELTELAGKTHKLVGLTKEIPVSYTEGQCINANGVLYTKSDWMVSDFLDISTVAAGDTFVWSGISQLINGCLAFYTEDGTLMQVFSATGASRTITIASNAAAIGATKVRASFLLEQTPSLTHNGVDVLESNIKFAIKGLGEMEDELHSLSNTVENDILTGLSSHTLENNEFIQGTNRSDGSITTSIKRCITSELYDVDKETVVEIESNGQAHIMLTYDADGTYRGDTTGWVTADTTYTFDSAHKVRFLVSWDGSTSNSITPEQIVVVFTIKSPSKIIEVIDTEIDAKIGKVSISDNDSFCRYNKKIKVYNPYKDHPTNQYKGQMHCHTTNSDGGLAPSAVVAKYVGYGYDFMTITDHNYITPNPSPEADIVWMGDSYEDTRNSAGFQHMNVWNCSEVINRSSQYQTTNTPQSLVNHYVKDGDSVLSYNHPEYPPVYASESTLEGLPDGISFVEIYNSTIQTNLGTVAALPSTANYGDMVIYNGTRYINQSTTKASPNWQSTTAEANPDGNLDRGFRIMLDSGKKVFCDAVDDFHRGDNMENRGWQMVFANSRTKQSLWNGLLMGASYASTGVYLNDVSFVDGVFKLDIADGVNAVTTFYGYNNEVLGTSNGTTAIYEVTGDEKYVRAMVEIDEKKAWTQPVWIIDVGKQYEF